MILRKALISDSEALRTLFSQVASGVSYKPFFNWPDQVIEAELIASEFLVAEDELLQPKRLAGFISYRENRDEIEIMALAIHADYRRQQIMIQLIAQLQDYSRKASKSVLLEVHEQNKAAIELYRKMNFVLISQRKKYYSDLKAALVFKWTSA